MCLLFNIHIFIYLRVSTATFNLFLINFFLLNLRGESKKMLPQIGLDRPFHYRREEGEIK